MKDVPVLQPDLTNNTTPDTKAETVRPRRVKSIASERAGARATDTSSKQQEAPEAPERSKARLDILRRAASNLARRTETETQSDETRDTPATEPLRAEKTAETSIRQQDAVAKAAAEPSVAPKADPEPVAQKAEPTPRVPTVTSSALVSYDTWNDLPRISLGARLDGQPAQRGLPSLIEYFRADPIAKGFDLLRTRLVRTIRAYGWRKIAVVAPTPGCGATFTAVNLALSLSRMPGSRTVLMDMNQRAPGVANALGVRTANRLDEFLQAKTRIEDYFLRPSKSLAVGLAAVPSAYAAEALHDPLAEEVLDDMIERLDPDLVIYDLPAMLAYDDMTAFLPQVDGVLLVVDGTQTLPDHISACERIFEGQTQLLGVVLNRGRTEGNTDIMV